MKDNTENITEKYITKLGELWQEEIMNLSNVGPESLDGLENRIENTLNRLGKALMEWKLEQWDSSTKEDKCSECGSKVHNCKRTKQILTTVSNVEYERYMSYSPRCKKTEYPLDKVLGLRTLQRMSSSVEKLAILCGASWDYGKSEYILSKLLRHDKLSRKFRKQIKLTVLKRLSGYIERNREGIWYEEAKKEGISMGSGSADKAGDILIRRRMKLRGIRWSKYGSNAVENIRILVLNGEWDKFWSKYKAA